MHTYCNTSPPFPQSPSVSLFLSSKHTPEWNSLTWCHTHPHTLRNRRAQLTHTHTQRDCCTCMLSGVFGRLKGISLLRAGGVTSSYLSLSWCVPINPHWLYLLLLPCWCHLGAMPDDWWMSWGRGPLHTDLFMMMQNFHDLSPHSQHLPVYTLTNKCVYVSASVILITSSRLFENQTWLYK